MNSQVVYFENLTLFSLLISLFDNKDFRGLLISDLKTIYYFDTNIVSKNILKFTLLTLGIKICKLEFKMIDIVDNNGELIRTRIPRLDLFILKDKIISSNTYKKFNFDDTTSNYILKEICNDGIMNQKSSARLLYIIEVVKWHKNKNKIYNEKIFFVDKRHWFDSYKSFAIDSGINLINYRFRKNSFHKSDIIKLLYGYPSIYKLLKLISFK